MRDEIGKEDIKQLNHYSVVFTVMLILFIVSVVPLSVILGIYGLIIAGIIWGVSMIYAKRIEKIKKRNDIQTFKEILAFTEGERLDEIDKAKESGKRPYQKFLLVFLVGLISFMVCILFLFLLI